MNIRDSNGIPAAFPRVIGTAQVRGVVELASDPGVTDHLSMEDAFNKMQPARPGTKLPRDSNAVSEFSKIR